ncbi:MAG: hypothetical protein K6U77_01885 [Armatimonadetes bacterium]|nr:hypothetical protein [Armatimonadota bacterium]
MRKLIATLGMLIGLSLAGVYAQQGGMFDLTWWTIDSGGVTFATGGMFEMGGTVGQHDAHEELYFPGANFLNGGFWFEPCWTSNGDVDGDGCVDDADLLFVLFNFGNMGQHLADVNCDEMVDDADLLIVLFNFGAGC